MHIDLGAFETPRQYATTRPAGLESQQVRRNETAAGHPLDEVLQPHDRFTLFVSFHIP